MFLSTRILPQQWIKHYDVYCWAGIF